MGKILVDRDDLHVFAEILDIHGLTHQMGELGDKFYDLLNAPEYECDIPAITITKSLESYIDAEGEIYYGIQARTAQLCEYLTNELGLEFDVDFEMLYGEHWEPMGIQFKGSGGSGVFRIYIENLPPVEMNPTCQFCGLEESSQVLKGGAAVGEDCVAALGNILFMHGSLTVKNGMHNCPSVKTGEKYWVRCACGQYVVFACNACMRGWCAACVPDDSNLVRIDTRTSGWYGEFP